MHARALRHLYLLLIVCSLVTSPIWAAPVQLMAPTPAAGDGFGTAVALDNTGTRLLVGVAPSPIVQPNPAVAYLYMLMSGQWQLTSTFSCNEGSYSVGVALSADGNTAIVSGLNGACLYQAVGGTWAATPSVVATFSGVAAGNFPITVALSSNGKTALVGSPAGGPGPGSSGIAVLYQASGGVWAASPSAVATFSVSGNIELGADVALSSDGNTALVTDPFAGGAPGCNTGGSGAAYIYQASGGIWAATPTPTATLTALVNPNCEQLGWSAAMSADGNTVLLGAPNFGNQDNLAGAFIFQAAAGVWSTTHSYVAFMSGAGSLGKSVALSADDQMALLGDYTNNTAAVYETANGSWPGSPVAGVGLSGNSCQFAFSLALSGDGLTSAVGAPVCQPATAGSVFIAAVAPPVYAPPVATSGTLTVTESMNGQGTLAATPASGSDTLTFAILTQPMHGSVTLSNAATGAYTYTPTMGYYGTDSFTFSATDNQNSLTSNTATVNITVNQVGGGGGNGGGGYGGGAFDLLVLVVLVSLAFVLRFVRPRRFLAMSVN